MSLEKGIFRTKTEKIPKNERNNYMKNAEFWISFWRKNPNRFVSDYLGITLKDFQELLLNSFMITNTGILVATRGLGKSFITALIACVICILYPNSKVVIACKVQKQADKLLLDKVKKELCSLSPMLKREIEDIVSEKESKICKFKNGSTISTTNISENARGIRATFLIVDEAVQANQNILESVIIPTTNATRLKPFKNNPKYQDYYDVAENIKIYLTSAWYKQHYFYQEYYLKNIRAMLNGKKSVVFSFASETALKSGILSKEKYEELKETLDLMKFNMEVETIFYGENADSWFSAEEVSNCMILDEVYYPMDSYEYMLAKKSNSNYCNLTKEIGEIRTLAADIAIKAGKRNDNSVYSLQRIRKKKGNDYYTKEIVYIESQNGMQPDEQALRIKRLFYEFECDRMIIDTVGVGIAVYNELSKETYDAERGVYYPPWEAYNKVDCIPCIDYDGKKAVMYAMNASMNINHLIAVQVKTDLNSKKLLFPLNDTMGKEILETEQNFYLKSGSEQARLILPFAQSTALFTEMIDLSFDIKNDKIQIKETGSNRKDRYSSISYNVFLAEEILKEIEDTSSKNKIIFFT